MTEKFDYDNRTYIGTTTENCKVIFDGGSSRSGAENNFGNGRYVMKYQIKCAEPEQYSMFYSDCAPSLRNACIGHLRMDFGSDNEFYSSWWENRGDLKDSAFKSELNDVVREFRKVGLLKNRSEMQRYCAAHRNLNLNESHGFCVETDEHLFLLRCRPARGNYDCYCYCYDKHELKLVQEQSETQSPRLSL